MKDFTERSPLLPSSEPNPPLKIANIVLANNENPKKWTPSRKWFCAILVSMYALMGPVSSAMVVPALPQISHDLDIPGDTVAQLLVSAFVLGYCIGPLLIAPMSEVFGRAKLLNWGHASFLVLNTLCIFVRDKYCFLGLRFVVGLVGSAPLAVRVLVSRSDVALYIGWSTNVSCRWVVA